MKASILSSITTPAEANAELVRLEAAARRLAALRRKVEDDINVLRRWLACTPETRARMTKEAQS